MGGNGGAPSPAAPAPAPAIPSTSTQQQAFTPQLAPTFQQVGDSPGARTTATAVQYAPGGQSATGPSLPGAGPLIPPMPSPYGAPAFPTDARGFPLASGAFDVSRETMTEPWITPNTILWGTVIIVGGLIAFRYFDKKGK